uniref:Ribonuclease Z n=1 Tax=Panagrolaimus sp. ES5 TaxID=591445 RepID=A0AC34FV42_9BILA
MASPTIQPYFTGSSKLDYIVHLTKPEIFDTELYQSFSSKTWIEECQIDIRPETNVIATKVINDNVKEKWDTICSTLPVQESEPFPKIIFFGTSSATPSKYRNVTSNMVQTADSFYLIDCGEGTFGQMKHMFGPKISEVLTKLRVIFMTHTHQDHVRIFLKFEYYCLMKKYFRQMA